MAKEEKVPIIFWDSLGKSYFGKFTSRQITGLKRDGIKFIFAGRK